MVNGSNEFCAYWVRERLQEQTGQQRALYRELRVGPRTRFISIKYARDQS